jgi:predicted anti-sigma-YlaC factor YlaD
MQPVDCRPQCSKRLPSACEAANGRWILLRDGEVPEAEAPILRRHLQECARCRGLYRLLDGLLAAIQNEPIPEPDDAFWERMREQIMVRVRAIALPPFAGGT